MNKILKNLLINQKGGTALLITLLILFAIFTVTFTASDIVISGLKMSKERYDSTKAYFAAESAGERIIWHVREPDFNTAGCVNGNYISFNDGDCGGNAPCCNGNTEIEYTLSNNAKYSIQYSYTAPDTTLSCLGKYSSVGRRVQLKY